MYRRTCNYNYIIYVRTLTFEIRREHSKLAAHVYCIIYYSVYSFVENNKTITRYLVQFILQDKILFEVCAVGTLQIILY